MCFIKKCSFILFFLAFFFSPVTQVSAAGNCTDNPFSVEILDGSLGSNVVLVSGKETSLTVKLDVSNLTPIDANGQPEKYQLFVYDTIFDGSSGFIGSSSVFTVNQGAPTQVTLNIAPRFNGLAFSFDPTLKGFNQDSKYVYIYKGDGTANSTATVHCYLGEYRISRGDIYSCSEPVKIYQNREVNGTLKKCYVSSGSGCIDTTVPIYAEGVGILDPEGNNYSGGLVMDVLPSVFHSEQDATPPGGFNVDFMINTIGNYTFRLRAHPPGNFSAVTDIQGACASTSFSVVGQCSPEQCMETPSPGTGTSGEASFKLCNQIIDPASQAKCRTCAGTSGQDGVWTAVGCISRNPVDIARRLIQVGLGMGGGVALIMTLAGGFILSTSQGDPQKANQAKEMITNSVIGLLFVIFSVVILQFIGVTILQIPGFGAPTQ